MSSTEDKAIRVITFDGKKTNWNVWEEKFLARARRKGFKSLLLGKEIPPNDDEDYDESTKEGQKKAKLKDKNITAYEELILSIDGTTKQGKVAFNLVKGAKTKNLSEGNAHLAWTRLTSKYAAKNAPTLLKLKREFTNSKLDNQTDPEEWITNLEEIQTRLIEDFKSEISEEDMIIHVLNNLPSEYDTEVAILEKRLGDKISALTLEEIREDLSLRFEKIWRE